MGAMNIQPYQLFWRSTAASILPDVNHLSVCFVASFPNPSFYWYMCIILSRLWTTNPLFCPSLSPPISLCVHVFLACATGSTESISPIVSSRRFYLRQEHIWQGYAVLQHPERNIWAVPLSKPQTYLMRGSKTNLVGWKVPKLQCEAPQL